MGVNFFPQTFQSAFEITLSGICLWNDWTDPRDEADDDDEGVWPRKGNLWWLHENAHINKQQNKYINE